MTEAAHEMTLQQRLMDAISIRTVFEIHIGGLTIPISDTVVSTWIVIALLCAVSLILTRNMRMVPKRPQLVLESFIGFIRDTVERSIGHHGHHYVPYIGSVFIFLIVSNIAPVITPMGGFGQHPAFLIKPATRDINITAAFALCTMAVVIFAGIRHKGIASFIKSFAKPVAFITPFKILEYGIKPLSLSLRLFGNIMGAYIIMQLIEAVVPLVLPPVAALYFDLFDGLIQAVIFSFLSTMYIAEAVE